MPSHVDPAMRDCIEACNDCSDTCMNEAMTFCLEKGGRHVEPEHVRLMIDCADICRTAADFMLRSSAQHVAVCGVCAEICDACAESCEQVGEMEECAQLCRRCADSCRQMARQSGGAGARRRDTGQTARSGGAANA